MSRSKAVLTLGEAVAKLSSQFESAQLYFGHGTDNAWDEACFLVLTVCKLPPNSDRSVASRVLTDAERHAIEALAQRRIAERIPLSYLLKEAWFAGFQFYVDERVLIPRSSFGDLIKKKFKPWLKHPGKVKRILDLCTGSACMAIAAAHYFPNAQVDAVDISADALLVAAKNIALHQLNHRVSLIQSDLFDQVPVASYDLVMSNPPYVNAKEMRTLPSEYRHEPEIALKAGSDGLLLVRRILQKAKAYLSEEGKLFVEVGNSWPALEAQFPNLPVVWVESLAGEDGIFMLHRKDLR